MTTLDRAWLGLGLLSAFSTAIAFDLLPDPYSGALILAAAWAKARLVILHYLGLADVPGWREGFSFCLALFVIVLFGLYVVGSPS